MRICDSTPQPTPPQLNTLKIMAHTRKGDIELSSYPRDLIISLTTACNQICRFCSGVHDKATEAVYCSPDAFIGWDWLKFVGKMIIVGAGEALCHPHYPALIRRIRGLAPYSDITLYTNGLALSGSRLDATVECCDAVYISQNAVTKNVYNTIILNGNHEQSLKNLKKLAELKPKKMRVTLSTVVIKETVGELKKFIDLAEHHKFSTVRAIRGFYREKKMKALGLSPESFSLRLEDYYDVQELTQYAKDRNVEFMGFDYTIPSYCDDPWTTARLIPVPAGWEFHICCSGRVNIFCSERCLAESFFDVWNHEHMQFIRRTVNSEEVLANKMCSLCRLMNKLEKGADMRKAALGDILRVSPDGFFPPVHLE